MALLLGFSFFLAGCGGGGDAPESSPAPEGESVSTGTGASEAAAGGAKPTRDGARRDQGEEGADNTAEVAGLEE